MITEEHEIDQVVQELESLSLPDTIVCNRETLYLQAIISILHRHRTHKRLRGYHVTQTDTGYQTIIRPYATQTREIFVREK